MDRGDKVDLGSAGGSIRLGSASPDFPCSLGSCWNLFGMSLRAGFGALRVRPSSGLLLLGVLLLSAGLVFADTDQEGGDAQPELQCLCVATTSQVRPKHINSLEMIKAGPHCPTVQIIATLRNGRKICLNQRDRLYKKIIKKLLEN